MSKKGALPQQTVVGMLDSNIFGVSDVKNVKPSSLDLVISGEIYRLDGGIFLPFKGEKVSDILSKTKKDRKLFIDGKASLKKDVSYVVKLKESFDLPSSVYAYANPKSSSGRLDMHVRLLSDGITRFDTLYRGYKGDVWLLIIPKTFDCVLEEGMSLNQIRFFNGDTRLNETDLEIILEKQGLVFDKSGKKIEYSDLSITDNDGSIILTLDMSIKTFGYRAIKTDKKIDLSRRDYDWEKFFDPLEIENGRMTLKKGEFYILVCHERVRVPQGFACEMVPMDERTGEFRSHYAGFIDPGWGCGENDDQKGRPLVMEVRPFEDISVRDGYPIAKIRFERLVEDTDLLYDDADSNYSQQSGPKLAKQFA